MASENPTGEEIQGGDFRSAFFSASAEDKVLTCLGYDLVQLEENDLEVLLKLTRLVDQVEQANSFTKSAGRKKCHTTLVKCKFDVEKAIASLTRQEKTLGSMKPQRAHSSKDDEPQDQLIDVVAEGEDGRLSPGNVLDDPMLSSSPKGNGYSDHQVQLGSPRDIFSYSNTDGSTITVTVDLPTAAQSHDQEENPMEGLPFEMVNDSSSETVLDVTECGNDVQLSSDNADGSSTMKKSLDQLDRLPHDQNLPTDIFQLNAEREENVRKNIEVNNDAEALLSETVSDDVKSTKGNEDNIPEAAERQVAADISIEDSFKGFKTRGAKRPARGMNLRKSILNLRTDSDVAQTDFVSLQRGQPLGVNSEEDSSGNSASPASRRNEKRRLSKPGIVSRSFIIHGQPREVAEALPLAITYGTEPKIATFDAIRSYIAKHYPSADLTMLESAMEKGVKDGKWSEEGGEERCHTLLKGRINPTKDFDLEGKICNAIIACNKPKCASFQMLKSYMIDFHDEMGVTARNVKPLKDAIERAIYHDLIRPAGNPMKAMSKMQYELVPDFVPSPVILQGNDVEEDYSEMDDSEKLMWTPLVT